VLLMLSMGLGWTTPLAAQPAPAPKRLDQRIDRGLREVAALGAEAFNNGDAAGCCRLFEGALMMLEPLLEHRPALRKGIGQGLEDARRNPRLEERAFLLREVIDRTRAAVKPAAHKSTAAVSKDVGFALSARERTLLELTNKEREKEGLKLLRANPKLFAAARAHSANMARQDKLAHELDDKKPDERMRAAGYEGANWGENIAGGMPTPATAMEVWMNSEGHRGNILNPGYSEIGIGIATNERGVPYYTQVFGTPFRP